MRNFFIVGLPRSRTAWLANLLTFGECFCFHEALAHVDSPQKLPEAFANAEANIVGDADPSAPLFHMEIAELFPAAHYVFIERNYDCALKSYLSFIRDNPLKDGLVHDEEQATAGFAVLARRLAEMKEALSNQHTLTLDFRTLDARLSMDYLHDFCTGAPMNTRQVNRWLMLRSFRINVMPRKLELGGTAVNIKKLAAYRASGAPPKAAVPESSRPTNLHTTYNEAIAAMCGPNQAACDWLNQLLEVWLTWDHIADNDVIDKAMAGRVFENLLLAWTVNPFWQRHKELLTPVLNNVISAWRDSPIVSSSKDYDVYVEVPCAVAYLLGGSALVKQHLPGLRWLVAQIRAEDDAKDI